MNKQETVTKSLVGASERLRTLRAYNCSLKPLNRLKMTTLAETIKVMKSVSVPNALVSCQQCHSLLALDQALHKSSAEKYCIVISDLITRKRACIMKMFEPTKGTITIYAVITNTHICFIYLAFTE